jgi:predicted phosphodiesterase
VIIKGPIMSQWNRRELLAAAVASPFAGLAWAQSAAKDPYADGILVDGPPAMPASDSFTIAVLPDTQHYSEKYPATYKAQTEWIAQQAAERRIAMVLHLGDITNKNTAAEWANASAAMTVLEAARVPYAFCPGNHDYSTLGACKDRTTLLSETFTVARCQAHSTFKAVYDKEPTRTENSAHTFTAAGRDFLVIALEFGPRRDVLRWANEIAAAHPKHEAILITHAFIYHDDTRYDYAKYGAKQSWNPHVYAVAKATNDDVHDGEEIWKQLICKHRNFILTLNGHVLGDGLGKVITDTPDGRAIPQLLVNFQMRPHGGDGWLRLLELKSDRTIHAIDYSPMLNKRNESKQNQFTVKAAPIA